MASEKNSEPLTPTERAAIQRSVDARGATETAKALDVHRQSVINALAGVPLRRGTLRIVRENLSRLKSK